MATRITNTDCRRVHDLLVARLGGDFASNGPDSFLTLDNWRVRIGGWHHVNGWSRGFTAGDNLMTQTSSRGYVTSKHDGGRYEGAGWHTRMADDIVETIETLRLSARESPRLPF